MSTMYWILVLSKLGEFLSFLGGVAFGTLVILSLFIIIPLYADEYMSDDERKNKHNTLKLVFKWTAVSLIVIMTSMLIPNKKEFAVIYGVGTVKEYVETNKEVKKLPDNVVKVINKELEELINDCE